MSFSDISISSNADSVVSSGSYTLSSTESWETTAKISALKLASHLTDPICKVREYFYTFSILNETCKTTAEKVSKVLFLTLGMIACTLLTPWTAPMGAAIRGLVANLESKPYIYLEKSQHGKVLPLDKKITIVSHNQCYMPAGYSITDGQLTPSSDRTRMDANIQAVKKLNPDIVCLYEVPDICDASYISSQLSEYPFIIPVAGVRTIGPSSMMYVASKYKIVKDSIEFVPFEKGTELTGRARFSEKGFLSFDIQSGDERTPFASVISTHLQHSEIPANPTKGKTLDTNEQMSRAMQMSKIAKKIEEKVNQGRGVIFTGDLNQEEEELAAFLTSLTTKQIDWLRRDPSVQGKATWGGDKWCADLVGKESSGPLVLDYTFIAGKAKEISTQIIETGYSGLEFRSKATSDHALLFSEIIVG